MENERAEVWFSKRHLVLDIAGLSENQRTEGSIFLDGAGAEFVTPADEFEYSQVSTVLFRWGDPRAEEVFALMLEHDDAPRQDLLPFAASTVIDKELWMLAVQDKDFDPQTRYSSADHYRQIPFDEEEARDEIEDVFSMPRPRPQMIGQVGQRWVYFERAVDISEDIQPIEAAKPAETEVEDQIALSEATELLKRMFGDYDFESVPEANRYHIATNVAHWALENFGRLNNEGNYILSTVWDSEHKGIPGEDMPAMLKPLLIQEYLSELYFTNDNHVIMFTEHGWIETDPYIPQWEQISSIPTMSGQLNYIKSTPEVVNYIRPGLLEFFPQVSLCYEPDSPQERALEFLISPMGISLSPYGERKATRAVSQLAQENAHNSAALAKLVTELSLLTAEKSFQGSRTTMPKAALKQLTDRLEGKEEIPIIRGAARTHPRNATKYLLIHELRKQGF